MRSQMESTSLALSLLLLVIYIPKDSSGQVMECTPSIKVQRNTRYVAMANKPLKISCPMLLCGQNFNFTWCRFDNLSSCRPVDRKHSITYELKKPTEDGKLGFMFLHFGNLSMDDAGEYRCGMSSFVRSYASHYIIINVTNQESLENRNENSSSTGMLTEEELASQDQDWIPYFSICTIILAVVILVMMISFLCIYGCKGLQRLRNKAKSHCQNKATKDEGKLGASTADQTAVDTDCSHVHDNEWERRDGSVIYVTLNHQSRQEDSARVSIALEDLTEYATIQVS